MNQGLRQHVTRVGFNLSLTTNQIAKLVEIAEHRYRSFGCGNDTQFVATTRALHSRGLVTDDRTSTNNVHSVVLTRAGWAVVDLLHESGLYDEYRDVLWPGRASA